MKKEKEVTSGSVYFIADDFGFKIGKSRDDHVDDRVESVIRGRGTGTCKVMHIRRGMENYGIAEDWVRSEVMRLGYSIPINEWHNGINILNDRKAIDEIISIIDSFMDSNGITLPWIF